MKLSTGKIAFPIEFDNGDKIKIFFNPNDPDLAIRLRDFQKKVEEKTNKIADVKLDADGKPVGGDVEAINRFEQMQKVVIEELNYAFNSDISTELFKYCSPFALVDGSMFIMNFVEAIIPEIQKVKKKSNAKAEKKMQEYIGKYIK